MIFYKITSFTIQLTWIMKILLLKQNPDPFVKRLSPGATLFS